MHKGLYTKDGESIDVAIKMLKGIIVSNGSWYAIYRETLASRNFGESQAKLAK